MLLAAAAWYTDWVGIYAVFGAFVLGAAMPRGEISRRIERQVQPLTVNLLLPLFFVYSGLNTRIGLVNSLALWGLALLVLFAATLGKGVACYAAARLGGEPHREAVGIGALMNARGLMELIILNIGLERGVITPTLFSIMVVMAVVTTLTALPVFNLAFGKKAIGEEAVDRPAAAPGPFLDD
jgi:Kef-type K+ transport system membrane component KefB